MQENKNYCYRLFIDDDRWPVTPDWIIARTPLQAQQAVENYGVPIEIAFDHDLGTTSDGREMKATEFVNWFMVQVSDGKLSLPDGFNYSVHSQNPIGAEGIKSKMDQLIRYYGK